MPRVGAPSSILRPPLPTVRTMAPAEEQVGDADRLVEEAAGVVAQVEDEPVHAAARIGLELLERLDELALGAFLELLELQVADPAKERRLDGGDVDDSAHELEVLGRSANPCARG